MFKKLFYILCFFTITFSLGCQTQEESSVAQKRLTESQIILATINKEPLTLRDYKQSLQQLIPAYGQLKDTPDGEKVMGKLRRDLLDQLITKHLMLQEAKRLKIEVSPVELNQLTQRIANDYAEVSFKKILKQEGWTIKQWQQTMEKDLLVKKLIFQEIENPIIITEEDINNYYEKNRGEFSRPERVRIRQIVVENELDAYDLRKKLRRNADFAKLAETHSLSPEGSKGGDLGYFHRGQMPPEFEAVAFSLTKKGEISKVFNTSYGYHIFKLEDRQPAHTASLEEVREEIREKLRQQKVEVNFNTWMANLRAKATIKINPYFIKNS